LLAKVPRDRNREVDHSFDYLSSRAGDSPVAVIQLMGAAKRMAFSGLGSGAAIRSFFASVTQT
jgi:hypothetical protein